MPEGTKPPDPMLELYIKYRDLCLVLDLDPLYFVIKLLASKGLQLKSLLTNENGVIAA